MSTEDDTFNTLKKWTYQDAKALLAEMMNVPGVLSEDDKRQIVDDFIKKTRWNIIEFAAYYMQDIRNDLNELDK